MGSLNPPPTGLEAEVWRFDKDGNFTKRGEDEATEMGDEIAHEKFVLAPVTAVSSTESNASAPVACAC